MSRNGCLQGVSRVRLLTVVQLTAFLCNTPTHGCPLLSTRTYDTDSLLWCHSVCAPYGVCSIGCRRRYGKRRGRSHPLWLIIIRLFLVPSSTEYVLLVVIFHLSLTFCTLSQTPLLADFLPCTVLHLLASYSPNTSVVLSLVS